jgi:ferric-dicitrate binding protein FerR (iron transport regulator)
VTVDRDVVGELVRAAGRREAPRDDEYQQVLQAAFVAWQRTLRARRRRRWVLALAAVFALGAIGLAMFFERAGRGMPPVVAVASIVHGNVAMSSSRDATWQPLQRGAAIRAGARIRSGTAAGLALELPGGVVARLDQRSEFSIESARRIRLIVGTIYVDSGTGSAVEGLRVITPLGWVSDVGTIFQITARPDSVRIRVREGRVQLDSVDGYTHVRSDAGQEIRVDPNGAVRHAFSTTHPAWAWAEALAAAPDVEGRPLLQFLTWVAHETGRTLQFQDADAEAQAREVILHGTTRGLTPLQALDLMLSTTDLQYALSNDRLIVFSSN